MANFTHAHRAVSSSSPPRRLRLNVSLMPAKTQNICVPAFDVAASRLHRNASSAGTPSDESYQYLGLGTHFLGDTVGDPVTELSPVTPGIYTAGTAWTIAGANGGWSRFRTGMAGQTGVGIVCESCHELEPDKNNSLGGTVENGHLLLASFREGENGDETAPPATADGRPGHASLQQERCP